MFPHVTRKLAPDVPTIVHHAVPALQLLARALLLYRSSFADSKTLTAAARDALFAEVWSGGRIDDI
jgi:hypothetical protein